MHQYWSFQNIHGFDKFIALLEAMIETVHFVIRWDTAATGPPTPSRRGSALNPNDHVRYWYNWYSHQHQLWIWDDLS